jgi:hypothetical protein
MPAGRIPDGAIVIITGVCREHTQDQSYGGSSPADLFWRTHNETDEEAKKQYPQGWRAPRPYIRIVPQPSA